MMFLYIQFLNWLIETTLQSFFSVIGLYKFFTVQTQLSEYFPVFSFFIFSFRHWLRFMKVILTRYNTNNFVFYRFNNECWRYQPIIELFHWVSKQRKKLIKFMLVIKGWYPVIKCLAVEQMEQMKWRHVVIKAPSN